MRQALIKGETHSSQKDKQALLDLDLAQYDAMFREGHDKNYFERDITTGYALFAIGHLLYGATFNRFYTSSEDIREKARSQDVPWIEADASVCETYEMVPRWKRTLLLLVAPFAGLLLFGLVFTPIRWIIESVAPGWSPIIGAIGIVLLFGFLWALQYFILIEGEVMSDRDEYMAETVVEAAEENDYNRVLISCGDKHRSGIASELREQGWTVEEQGIESWFGKVLAGFDKVGAAILQPRNTASKIWSQVRI